MNKKQRTESRKAGSTPVILMRRCPPHIFEMIGKMKTEMLEKNKYRGRVSNEEAIYRLIERCGEIV